jgi:hypothetical protein
VHLNAAVLLGVPIFVPATKILNAQTLVTNPQVRAPEGTMSFSISALQIGVTLFQTTNRLGESNFSFVYRRVSDNAQKGVHRTRLPTAVAMMVHASRRPSSCVLFTGADKIFWCLGSAVSWRFINK